MPRRFLSIDEARAEDGTAFATPGRMIDALPERCIRYAFSDATVGRDMHTIEPGAWITDNFERNPVFLWAHQDDELPVGRVENLATQAGRLIGQVRYAEHDFADTVYQMVKGGFLNATSTGWLPLEWRAANDRKRPGGLDFTRVELLEISQVPVPALPTALVTARSAGIDVKPLYDWAERWLDGGDFAVIGKPELEALRKAARMPKLSRESRAAGWACTAARDLPIDDKTAWDGTAAASRMLDAATHDGKLDVAKAGRGFLLHDGSGERGGFKEPFADLIDGKLTAIAGGIRAAAQRLPDVKGADEAAMAKARQVIEAYHKKLADEVKEPETSPERNFGALVRRAYERGFNDGHDMAARMLGEESSEYSAGAEAPEARYWSAANLEAAVARALEAHGLARKGKKYSAETVRCLRAIRDHVSKAHTQLSDVLDEADDDADPEADAPDDEPDDAERAARALRERKAKAAALKAGVLRAASGG